MLEFAENRVFAAARPEDQEGGLGREVKLRQAIEAALLYTEGIVTKQPLIDAQRGREDFKKLMEELMEAPAKKP